MHYLLEASFIGIYSLTIYLCMDFILSIGNPTTSMESAKFMAIFFFLGMLKHGLGYSFGLQTYYCRLYKSKNAIVIPPTFMELVGEGLLYVIVGKILSLFIRSCFVNNKDDSKHIFLPAAIAFLSGFLLHVSFEISGLHKKFVDKYCL